MCFFRLEFSAYYGEFGRWVFYCPVFHELRYVLHRFNDSLVFRFSRPYTIWSLYLSMCVLSICVAFPHLFAFSLDFLFLAFLSLFCCLFSFVLKPLCFVFVVVFYWVLVELSSEDSALSSSLVLESLVVSS
jgi:hypothetical protein